VSSEQNPSLVKLLREAYRAVRASSEAIERARTTSAEDLRTAFLLLAEDNLKRALDSIAQAGLKLKR